MVFVSSIVYIIYIIAVLYYISKIYGTSNVKKGIVLLVTLVNSFLFFVPIYLLEFNYEGLVMIVFFVVLGIEVKLIYKQSYILTVACVLCFTINYFAIKVLLIGILSLTRQEGVPEIISSIDNRFIITIVTMLVLIPYIFISSKILIQKSVKFTFEDISAMKISCVLLGMVAGFQVISMSTIYVHTENIAYNAFFQIRTGVFAIVAFCLIMVIAFIFSRLKKVSLSYEKIAEKLKSEKITIEKLEGEAEIDFFTGFYVKSIVVDKLKTYLEEKEGCYVVFIDIDGLKVVNDRFGHEEGDWYIKAVGNEVGKVFENDTIARIGGDEFLIVGKDLKGEISIEEKIDGCQSKVISLRKIEGKGYETSISVGVEKVNGDNNLSAEEIIELADQKMYSDKKSKNKARR